MNNALTNTTIKFTLSGLGLAMSLLTASVYAGQATIPTTFVSGTPAKAGEVNANFNAVKTAIDDNDARITTNATATSQAAKRAVVVDANNQIIGEIFGGIGVNIPVIMTAQGFAASVSLNTGIIDNDSPTVYFTGSNCTGTAYMDWFNDSGGDVAVGLVLNILIPVTGPGMITLDSAGNPVLSPVDYRYIPKTPTFADNVAVQSSIGGFFGSSTCSTPAVNSTTSLVRGVEVFPNDPAITGVPNGPFAAPLKYDRR